MGRSKGSEDGTQLSVVTGVINLQQHLDLISSYDV